MTPYFVNRNEQPNGDHEVHGYGCRRLPGVRNRIYVGYFNSCHDAVIEARE